MSSGGTSIAVGSTCKFHYDSATGGWTQTQQCPSGQHCASQPTENDIPAGGVDGDVEKPCVNDANN
jgi:hypothetical protein